MTQNVYQRLCKHMAARGGRYPAMDIPEFYALAEALFTPEEAEVYMAIPKGYHPAETIAENTGRPAEEVAAVLENMANKGLATAGRLGDQFFYGAPVFVPGIFEFQFMKGTKTERDRKLARLIHDYKHAVDAKKGPPEEKFPSMRVIPVDTYVESTNKVHTYQQAATYIDKYDPISVSTCFCRHEAKLIDETDDCAKPDEVCMQFGMGAQFIIDRGMGRKISRQEAKDILDRCEQAGLVHASVNRQEIDFLCNCCGCHCVIIKTAMAQEKPGESLNSGFRPAWDQQRCVACETCIERCPTGALAMGSADIPEVNLDFCIGCGVCATGCPEEAIHLVARPGIVEPPVDQKALREAVKAARGQ